MQTVLITGCSSGFGLDIARHFHEKGWNVIATMRTPRTDLFPASDRMRVVALDVTDAASIRRAIDEAGPVDVLVNNAGIGVLSALEGMTMDTVRDVFETNTLGTIAMTQAVLPQLRERKNGVVINVTSSVTYRPLPLLSVYSASKAAVNAFTESLALELAPFNVRAHLVLPGRAPDTRFGENARARMQPPSPAYADFMQQVFSGMTADGPVTHSSDVAEAVWRAATDASAPMRIPAGADAVEWSQAARS